MFDKHPESGDRVAVCLEQFPVASELCNKLMTILLRELPKDNELRAKLFQVPVPLLPGLMQRCPPAWTQIEGRGAGTARGRRLQSLKRLPASHTRCAAHPRLRPTECRSTCTAR